MISEVKSNMASSSDSHKSFGNNSPVQTNLFDKDSFSRISEVQEAANNSWNKSFGKGKFGRSSFYSTSSTKRTTTCSTVKTTSSVFSAGTTKSTAKSVKTFSSKHTVTHSKAKNIESTSDNGKFKEKIDDEENDIKKSIEKRFQLPSSSHEMDASNFFKAKFPHDMDGDDFFRTASSRFSMRNLKSTSGWNVELDEGASLFPDFFPKTDAATKLSFEATWRAVSPTKEFGLAKQAIKNCSWEDEEKKNENENNAKQIVSSWMQFFGHTNSVKDG